MPRRFPRMPKDRRNFAERFYPARPIALAKRTSKLATKPIRMVMSGGPAIAANKFYIRWLERESMLENANKQAVKYSGSSLMWQKPYARPRPRAAIERASVWYTAYPVSMVTKPGDSILASFANDDLWEAFADIGIRGMHTGPMKQAGGLKNWALSPSTDGHFDRISTKIDQAFGTEEEFQRMCRAAAEHDAIIIDDIVPGHTGKGADFRLAEMGFRDYPGVYHMVEIPREDWHVLPRVPRGRDSVNIDAETEEVLKQKGHIVGKLHRVIFYEPGVKETNWSATREIRGVDGKKRRWVYLHYFKEGQPSINWLDPSFAGMKLVVGDALHSISDLGTSALRLDANGFLGIEKSSEDTPAWSEGHPLSEAANHLIASMVRKLGGFTFQELNLAVDDIKNMSEDGADLSYDFITRPAYHHALATGDTEFLRLMSRIALDMGIDPASLVHALQNHDELTFELVHFWTTHKDDDYTYHGKRMKGSELRETIRSDLSHALVGKGTPYNLPFTDNGIACTNASAIAAILGYRDVRHLSGDQIEHIKQLHLLLAAYNALQPGVFALSGWDLSGSLTLDPSEVSELIKEGDTRWINRGAYDLLGSSPQAKRSNYGLPMAKNLYGALPSQLKDPNSFASRLKKMLSIREACGIATGHQLEVPDVPDPGLFAMVHRLPDDRIQLTLLNFSAEPVNGVIESAHLPPNAAVTDMFRGVAVGNVAETGQLDIALDAFSYTSLVCG